MTRGAVVDGGGDADMWGTKEWGGVLQCMALLRCGLVSGV